MKLTTALRTVIATEILSAITNGTVADPTIEIYTGTTVPALGDPVSDTMLATLKMTTTAGTVTDGVLTMDAITSDQTADATGTAGWSRVLDRDGNPVIHITVADDGSGDLNLNSVNVVAGTPVAIMAFTITVGGV
jgi:hypothetical protein